MAPLLHFFTVFADGHCRRLHGMRVSHLSSDLLFFPVFLRQAVNKLICILLLIATVEHIHIAIVAILNTYFIAIICRIISIIPENMLSSFALEPI